MKKILFVLLSCLFLVGCGNNNNAESEKTPKTETEGIYSEEYQKGKELSEELIDEMESIDWEENYDKAREKGKEAAEFLNQFLGGN